jgi:sirohydrochlorin ferrochelatase
MTGILIISHGSRHPQTKRELEALAAELRKNNANLHIAYAFLEIETPSIPEGIDGCVKAGSDKVLILLNFLNSGKHVDEDIPRIVNEARKIYPAVRFDISRPIGLHPGITKLFQEYINVQK